MRVFPWDYYGPAVDDMRDTLSDCLSEHIFREVACELFVIGATGSLPGNGTGSIDSIEHELVRRFVGILLFNYREYRARTRRNPR